MARSQAGREHDRGPIRRRSRSRERDRRTDDRHESRRHERYDDRDRDRDYRGPPRDRSRDRKRSSDYYRADDRYAPEHRPNKRPRRDGSSPPRRSSPPPRRSSPPPRRSSQQRRSHRDDDRDRRSGRLTPQQEKEVVDPAVAVEAAKREKLAKVEAWKKKILEKKRLEGGGSGSASPQVNAQTETSAISPDAGSPAATSQPSTGPGSPAADDKTPVSYAGKFDPKAIAARAAAAMERQRAQSATLGGDIVIPKSANQASQVPGGRLADNSKTASYKFRGAATPAQRDAKISGFGLSKTSEKQDKVNVSKGAAPMEEVEAVGRKLEKLPDMPHDTEDAALANVSDGQDDGDVDDLRSDDEEAELVREAALKRAEEAQAEETQHDDPMTGIEQTANGEDVEMQTEEDEVDPLDAFMNDLEQPADNLRPNLAIGKGKKKQPQVFNSDDEDDMEAVGDNTDDFLALAAKRKKKDIPTVNHGKVDYEPFRKNFYSESIELADMTPEEVEELRADLDNIKCRGVNVPKPIMKWSQGGFGAQILDVIREQKFEKPTSIQSQALPAIMSGRDVIGVAKTGSGKTLAFILPMFRHIKDQRPVENLEGPIGLILAPTRELATQIHRDCKPYLKALNLRAVCAYGGAPIKDQISELKRGAEIVVCTPGRFIDLLAANSGRVTNLRRVTYVVLDEADRMFDMGFEPQISKLLNNIRPDHQTVLFSATFPRAMEALARKALTKPVEIIVGGRSVVAPEITQIIEVRAEGSKFKRLLELLGDLHDKDEDARSLIFVERQETADSMLKELLRKGYPSVSVHGGREQIDRDQSVADFKAGIYPIMVATSVAARGLDVKQLKLVVNYDSPNHHEDYVHRAGRTGRAGNTGTAVTFVTPEQERFAKFLIKALTDSQADVPEDLTNLNDAHEEKVKAGEAKKIGSGFGGRGIERLDAARDAARAIEKKQHKIGDEPDEEEEEGEKKKTDKKESKVDDMVAKAAGIVKDRDSKPEASSDEILPAGLSNALRDAMKVQRAATPPAQSHSKESTALANAKAVAATLNKSLGKSSSARPGVPVDNRGPDAGAFHATLEINDFPQKARWGVTNRTNVAKILEATGTSITTKGNYYAPPKQPQAGEPPKLYILVEGDTEVQVESAMKDMTRLLKEGTLAAMDAENRAGPSGRYSVV